MPTKSIQNFFKTDKNQTIDDIYIEKNLSDTFKFALFLCSNLELAKDLTQDTFVKLIENFPTIQNKETIPAWLRVTLKNLYLDHLKSPKNNQLPISSDDLLESLNKHDLTTLHDITYALSNLSVRSRTAIILVDFQAFSYHEAAQIMQISDSALKSLLTRAKHQFKSFYIETK